MWVFLGHSAIAEKSASAAGGFELGLPSSPLLHTNYPATLAYMSTVDAVWVKRLLC